MEFLEEYFGKAGTVPRHARGQTIAGGAQPAAQSVGSETTSWRISAGRPSRAGRRLGARRRVVLLRAHRRVGPYRDGEDQVCRLQIVTISRTLNEPVTSREVLERTSVELVRSIFPSRSACACSACRCITWHRAASPSRAADDAGALKAPDQRAKSGARMREEYFAVDPPGAVGPDQHEEACSGCRANSRPPPGHRGGAHVSMATTRV